MRLVLLADVVFLVQRFPGYGGAEEYVFQLTRRLADSGFECAIFTSDLDNRPTLSLPNSVKVVRFPVFFRAGEYAVWKGLFRRMLEVSADVFHVNTYGYFHTDLVSLLHDFRKLKVVLTSHGFQGLDAFLHQHGTSAQKASLSSVFRRFARPFYDFTLGFNEIASADALVALSQNDVELFQWMGAGSGKIHEIPLGVRDIFFEGGDEALQDRLRERFDGEPVILSMGELSWVKGKDVPLLALATLVKDYPKARLVYVGKDGGMLAHLKKLAVHKGLERNVFFEGYVSSEALIDYYGVADVLVHTSYAEGLSTVLLEAMAIGLPVISTPAGGNAHLLQKSGAGIVVPFNDSESVCSALTQILSSVSLQRSLRAHGSSYALGNFKWTDITKKYLALYQSLSGQVN